MAQLEELILRADKMAALGQMVSGITHDIANPLGYVVLSASELMRELMVLKSSSGDISRSETAFPGMADLVESIDQDVRRVGQISKAMRDYTRLDSNPVVGVDLEHLVSDCLLIMGHRLRDVSVKAQCESGLTATCYRSHLGQVLTNLISNALHAMGPQEEKELEIGTRYIPIDGEEGIEIWVADNGPGLTRRYVNKFLTSFLPFGKTRAVPGLDLGYVPWWLRSTVAPSRLVSHSIWEERNSASGYLVCPRRISQFRSTPRLIGTFAAFFHIARIGGIGGVACRLYFVLHPPKRFKRMVIS